ncbi:MAG: cobalt-precorrin-6A reductase [Pseudomonadota bacterium]
MTRILLLGGTAEARSLARVLSEIAVLSITASLAGATSDPAPYACPTRTGGFGGPDGLAAWMRDNEIALLIDATHPYAVQMQGNAVIAARATGVPRLRLLRPPWPDRTGWVCARDIAASADKLPEGARALLTTGRKEIEPFVARGDCTFTLRSVEPVPDLPTHIAQFIARPPFSAEAEQTLFESLGITHLVSKNAGGTGTAKLDVAEDMRLTTIMVARPTPPPGPTADSTEAAVAWVREKVAF